MTRPASRIRFTRALCTLILLGAAAASAGGQAAGSALHDFGPDPLAVNLAATAEPLSLEDLVEGAIVFSGPTDAQRAAAAQGLQAVIAAFRRQAAGVTDARSLGELALSFLHDSVLRRYSSPAAGVDSALSTGDYNCVSSAVLYFILARSVGLPVGAVRTSDHVFCTVGVGPGRVDVETTNRYGFEPGTRREFSDTFGTVTGFTYVPPASYSERHAIGEKELLALILHDRVSAAVGRADHLGATTIAMTEWTLAPSDLSRSALVTSTGNAAAALGMADRFPDAFDLLSRVEGALGAQADLSRRRTELAHNWVVALAEDGDLDGADALLGDPARVRYLEPADASDLAVWIVQLRGEQPVLRGDYQAAADIITAGLARLGAVSELLRALEAYSHNAFAQLYNAKRFAEAKHAVDAALARYPDSRLLRQDLDLAAKALR